MGTNGSFSRLNDENKKTTVILTYNFPIRTRSFKEVRKSISEWKVYGTRNGLDREVICLFAMLQGFHQEGQFKGT